MLKKISPPTLFTQTLVAFLYLSSVTYGGDTSKQVDADPWSNMPEKLISLMEAHCVDCHDDAETKGGLNLYELSWNLKDAHNAETWVKIHDQIASKEMPPSKNGKPSKLKSLQRNAATSYLSTQIIKVQTQAAKKYGRSVSRRVNRFEYQHILRDLLHDPTLKVADDLPVDGEHHGFAKVGEVLDVSHVQMNAYLDIAEYALNRALKFPGQKPASKTKRYQAHQQSGMFRTGGNPSWGRWTLKLSDLSIHPSSFGRSKKQVKNKSTPDKQKAKPNSLAMFRGAYSPFYYHFNEFRAPVRGQYRIRIKARSVLRHTDYVDWEGDKKPRFYPSLVLDHKRKFPTPVNDRIMPGKRSEPVKIYSSTLSEPTSLSSLPIGRFEVPPYGADDPDVFELTGFMEKGARVHFDCMRLPSPMIPALPHTIQKIDPDGYPGVAFYWMEVEGPIFDKQADWPPASYKALFGDLPFKYRSNRSNKAISLSPAKDASRLLKDFMRRAYRRPITDREFNRFHDYCQSLLKNSKDFTEVMLMTYAAVLSSPEFLFQGSSQQTKTGELDNHALAERLSMFLNDSMPDQRLRQLAKDGKLSQKNVLHSEVERLLAKKEAKRFVNQFLDSWLNLDELHDTEPDRMLYPEYAGDWWLLDAMLKESRLFFTDLINSNLPAKNIIDSDSVFVDERLARHYDIHDISDITGPRFQRVKLPENSPYGGMMTQAAVLKVTANGTVTSPIMRGVYVMEKLLGEPPPPPPPAVPAVEPDIRGAKTIRELLKKHREDPACASCHRKIDPAGFALENFDVMGRWRTHYRSLNEGWQKKEGVGRSGNEYVHYLAGKVDASESHQGQAFSDVIAFKKILLKKEREIARNLTEQLITYATGAPVRFADHEDVNDILNQSQASGYGVKTLIHEIIQSPLFRRK